MNHTESGILAFVSFYKEVNRKTIKQFFGMNGYNHRDLQQWEKFRLNGKTFEQLKKEKKQQWGNKANDN